MIKIEDFRCVRDTLRCVSRSLGTHCIHYFKIVYTY
nr:MAG TPA: hypothetical protein [Caudoviricetes sp.]